MLSVLFALVMVVICCLQWKKREDDEAEEEELMRINQMIALSEGSSTNMVMLIVEIALVRSIVKTCSGDFAKF